MICKLLDRKLKIDQHKLKKSRVELRCSWKGNQFLLYAVLISLDTTHGEFDDI
jgi:hypothetical protein